MIKWRSDIENAPKDGRVFLAWFPLPDLGDNWCRGLPVYWHDVQKRWNFAGRVASGYSSSYEPTHWTDINGPEIPTDLKENADG